MWWCVGERGRGEERKGERRKKKRGSRILSILILLTPAGLIPCRANPLRDPLQKPSYHSPTYTTFPPTHPTQTQKWGIPTLLPTRGKGGKRGGKRTFEAYKPQFFSLGENPQTPPLYWDAQEKDKKSEGAR